jgi:ATP-binding cassette, subfamily B, bacterial
MSINLGAISWPAERIGDAIEALAIAGGLSPRAVAVPTAVGAALMDRRAREAWVEQIATYLGVEAELITVSYGEMLDVLRAAGPALLQIPSQGAPRFVALTGRAWRGVTMLRPDGERDRVPAEELADILCTPLAAPVLPAIERMLDHAAVSSRRRAKVRRVLLRERLSGVSRSGVWLLRSPPGASPLRQAVEARLPRRVLVMVATQVTSSLLLGLAWWTIGQGVLEDQLDRGFLLAWALLLLTAIPIGLLGSWSAGLLAIDAGGLLKRRLLAGALELEPEEVRHEGTGAFVGRVIESAAVELLALGAGLAAITATISLVFSGALLALGAGGWLQVLLLVAWVGVSIALVARYYRRRRRWTDARLAMTNDLVERMGGHRTRLAQEPRERWHDGEDQALARYLADAEALDRSYAALAALLPRGWFVVGVLGLVPAFVAGGASTASFAVSLGGVLLAGSALQGLVSGLSSLAGAAIAWRRVAPLFQAAARGEAVPPPVPPAAPDAHRPTPLGALLEAHELVFRHRPRGLPVVRGASLRIGAGDRLLLEGPSGGGKSTLSSLLAGLRAPESGLLLLDGLDRRSLGTTAWRRRVATAPQFHENHVLQNTFAFNLLMGRRWPPGPGDLAEAETICRELGLGALLDRMPAGLLQMVGETGWQLSHGEKSRLYIARAMLQGADILLLDESFAALDPETLGLALRCVLKRAPTVMVIAHP